MALEVLEKLHEKTHDVPIIMISGHGNIDTAVEAIKKGAYDFIEKPLDLNRLLVTMRNATERNDLVSETKVLKRRISKTYDIVGESPEHPQSKGNDRTGCTYRCTCIDNRRQWYRQGTGCPMAA